MFVQTRQKGLKEYRSRQVSAGQRCELDFGRLWELPLELLDKPNRDHSGTSEVFLWKTEAGVFVVKRQSDYCCRTWLHPLKGIPTAEREFHNLCLLKQRGLSVPSPVYFGRQRLNGRIQAILVTEYADGFVSLARLLSEWRQIPPSFSQRKEMITAAARLVRDLHQFRYCHRHLVPKHILLKPEKESIRGMLIDLETAERFRPFRKNRQSDLASLNHRCGSASRTDKLRFLFSYLEISKWTPRAKKFAREILKKSERKKQSSLQKRREKRPLSPVKPLTEIST